MAPRFDRRSLFRFGLGTAALALADPPALPATVAAAAHAFPGLRPRPDGRTDDVAEVAGTLVAHAYETTDGAAAPDREANARVAVFVNVDGSGSLALRGPHGLHATIGLPAPVAGELWTALHTWPASDGSGISPTPDPADAAAPGDIAEPVTFGGRLECQVEDGRDVNVRLEVATLPDGSGLVRARHLVDSTFPATGIAELRTDGATARALHRLLFATPPRFEEGVIPCPCCAGEGWLSCPLCGGEGATTRPEAARWRRGIRL
jgi:hypothetical protein